MNWGDVSQGDTITVKRKDGGGEVSGEVYLLDVHIVSIGGVTIAKSSYEVIKHQRAYRPGDIGVLSEETGTYVGIYDADKEMFYDCVGNDDRTPLFATYNDGIKVIGNIKELG